MNVRIFTMKLSCFYTGLMIIGTKFLNFVNITLVNKVNLHGQ